MSWNEDQGELWKAVVEALRPYLHVETELDKNKLEKRVHDYFVKAGKNLSFHSGQQWHELVEEYADNVFGSLFCALGDRQWLLDADFVLAVDAAVKDCFPAHLLQGIPPHVFEERVLGASDRAFDEQRYWTFRWEPVEQAIKGKVSQKKVRDAMDTGRVEAVRQGIEDPAGFILAWVAIAMDALAKTTQGKPWDCLPRETCLNIFEDVLQQGGLPHAMMQANGPPPPNWVALADAIERAYVHQPAGAYAGESGEPRERRRREDRGGKSAGKARPDDHRDNGGPPQGCKGAGHWDAKGGQASHWVEQRRGPDHCPEDFGLDPEACDFLRKLSGYDMQQILEELRAEGPSVRNPSGFVTQKAKHIIGKGSGKGGKGKHHGQEDWGYRPY